jgi:hypothetical protein
MIFKKYSQFTHGTFEGSDASLLTTCNEGKSS